MSIYKIGIIVTWFGKLPPYFPAWLKSAEANTDIDFLVFSDHDVATNSPNIKFYKMTMAETLSMFELKLNHPIRIDNSYKFCDCRPFFGIGYEDYLRQYDFWGYCDIDLVFGEIRHFLTDQLLDTVERFYQYGHLSLFRNNEKMNHLYEMRGGIYSLDEIFCGKAKTTPEEYFGINRICSINSVNWYTNADFADFMIRFPSRLEVKHGKANYEKQIFVWKNGRAYRIYEDNGIRKEEDFVYMHWQKRKPGIHGTLTKDGFLILTGSSLICSEDFAILDNPDYGTLNPPLSEIDRSKYNRVYIVNKLREFCRANLATKLMWMRQKIVRLISTKAMYP